MLYANYTVKFIMINALREIYGKIHNDKCFIRVIRNKFVRKIHSASYAKKVVRINKLCESYEMKIVVMFNTLYELYEGINQ